MALRDWVVLPTNWIRKGGLREFRWSNADGAMTTAALMLLIVIAQHADETGFATLTYDRLCAATMRSRTVVAAGLRILEGGGYIERVGGRSAYRLCGYDRSTGWAKLPARRMYNGETVSAFAEFSLRKPVELYALKLFLLFVAFRNRQTNMAAISYDKIEEYTGIERGNIKKGITFLAAQSLVHVEHRKSEVSDMGISNAYRIVYIEPYNHLGTAGRGREDSLEGALDDLDLEDIDEY